MRKSRILFTALLVLFSNDMLCAQTADMESVIGPSPNVAALFKFVDQPISLYSGTVDIKIPICTFKTGKIEVPISLAYHSGGIKVTENASWVGMGWALNAGGAVSASVYGLPDLSWLNNRFTKTTPNKCELTSILNGNIETQPDLFYFSFLNQSGEFYFNDSSKIMQIPYSKIKIELFTDTASAKHWRITNTDGTVYLFQQYELDPTFQQIVNGTTGGNIIPPGPGRPGIPSVSAPSWFLTKIISPSGDSVMFNYESYAAAYDFFTGETTYSQGSVVLDCGDGAIPVPANTSNYQLQKIVGYRLKSITSRTGTVQFITGGNRCDLLGDKYLSEVDVFDNTGKLVKKTTMTYNYLVSSSLYTPAQINCSAESQPSIGYVDVTAPSLLRRLMLMEVDEVSTTSNQTDGRYKMDYETSIGLPSKLSPQQDIWGYFNGNGQTSLLQNLSYGGLYDAGISVPTVLGRDPEIGHAEQGMLKKITYPTGGSSSLTYESNDYRNDAAPNHRAVTGGIRIKQISNYDSINNSSIIKTYDYSINGYSSGVFPGPILATPLTNGYVIDRDADCSELKEDIVAMLIFNSNTNYPLTLTHGSVIGYSQVTERTLDKNGNDRGMSVYTFSVNSDQLSGFSIISVPNDAGVYPPIQQDLYPFVPVFSNEWMRGNQLKKEDYKNMGSNIYQLVKRERTFYSQPKVMDTTHGMVVGYYLNSQLASMDQCTPALGIGYSPFSMYKYCPYQIFSEYITLDSTITETFDNSGNEVKTPIYYTYNSSNLLPSIIKALNSKKENVISYKKYPWDYAVSGTPSNNVAKAILNLQNKNAIAVIIENYDQKSNSDGSNVRTTSAIFTSYKADRPLPDTIYRLDATAPVTGFSPTTITNTSVTKNSNYFPLLGFDKYDAVGNLVQQRKINDVFHNYLWDYQKIYPVAEVINADSTSIAYSSFESDGSGNWTIPSGLRDSLSVAVTGRKSYSLANGSITKSGLTSSNTYIVSYWIKGGSALSIAGTISGYPIQGKTIGAWTYFEHKVTSQTTVTISGSVYIDELRLYPANALMTTYTYLPLIGMSSQCDAANKITYYQYDGMNRLKQILDQDHNIIKILEYHYHN